MELEDWEPIRGFPGYSVSSLGRVRKDATDRIMSISVTQYGTPYVGLMRGWDQYKRSLAKLVAKAFLPTPTEAFDTPINLNGDRFNCAVDNLMWRPRWFAVMYNQQFTHGRYDRPIEAPVRAVETGEVFGNSFEASCRYGLLERDLVLSIENNTVTWPSYMRFELAI